MVDLAEAFFNFRPRKSYRCRFIGHANDHYVDEIVIEQGVSIYLLHRKIIAMFNGRYLMLSHAEHHTPLTRDRLNAIASYLRDHYGINIWFYLRRGSGAPYAPNLIYEYNNEYYLFRKPIIIDVKTKKVEMNNRRIIGEWDGTLKVGRREHEVFPDYEIHRIKISNGRIIYIMLRNGVVYYKERRWRDWIELKNLAELKEYYHEIPSEKLVMLELLLKN